MYYKQCIYLLWNLKSIKPLQMPKMKIWKMFLNYFGHEVQLKYVLEDNGIKY